MACREESVPFECGPPPPGPWEETSKESTGTKRKKEEKSKEKLRAPYFNIFSALPLLELQLVPHIPSLSPFISSLLQKNSEVLWAIVFHLDLQRLAPALNPCFLFKLLLKLQVLASAPSPCSSPKSLNHFLVVPVCFFLIYSLRICSNISSSSIFEL